MHRGGEGASPVAPVPQERTQEPCAERERTRLRSSGEGLQTETACFASFIINSTCIHFS